MPKKSRSKAAAPVADTWDDPEMDELDAFDQNQDEILLEEAGMRGRGQRQPQHDDYELSDEEVMGLDDGEDEDEDEDEELDYDEMYGTKQQEQDDDELGWGNSRANYYGADDIDDEEGAQMEEEEARRLQKKHLAEMAEADYYDDDDMEDWKHSTKVNEDVMIYDQPDQDPTQMDDNERLDMLKMKYPELMPLAQELTGLSGKLQTFNQDSKVGEIKFVALSSYLGTIHAYFALFLNAIGKGKADLKDHPVMEGIVKAREVWRQASELDESAVMEEAYSSDDSEHEERTAKKRKVVESEPEPELAPDFDSDSELEVSEPENGDGAVGGESDEEDEFSVPLVKKKKQNKGVKIAKKVKSSGNDYAEGEEEAVDQEDRDKHRRSIRFYTSKIDQQSRNSKQHFTGGDDDLPYKERHFERQKRLMEEARQRGLKTGDDRAEDFGSDVEDDNQQYGGGDSDGDGDDYYNQVKKASRQKKKEKEEGHRLAVRAAKEGRLAELQESEQLDESGKRALNFQILKNKGLTPKRAKENRNARVKKRKRYEKAQKKLRSVRQTFKQPTSAYGGETTGIKKNLTRSVRFKS